MKLSKWLGALAVSTMLVGAACGGTATTSIFDGGPDSGVTETGSDAPHLILDSGRTDGKHDGSGGGGGACNPLTCAKLGYDCGPAGDGCGGSLDCGTCKAPETCGGGGKFSRCGGMSSCVPKTCKDLGLNCGPAGDGCGGSLSCGTCTAPDICGGGGVPSVCGDTTTCTGLCTEVPKCDGSTTTTITGTVVAGTQAPWLGASSPDPVPNVFVYIPNGAIAPFTDGPECGCATVSGDPLPQPPPAQTTTDYLGNFTLTNVPVPPSGIIPLVIQLGRWRRVFGLGNPSNPGFGVTACTANSAGAIHMPRNQGEGDIPLTAVSTGSADAMECVLLKMGVDQAEFTDPTGTGRIHVYQGNGATIDGATPAETQLVPLAISATELNMYDQVLFPCWGEDPIPSGSGNAKTTNQQTNVINYTTAGGRVFATHFSYSWLYDIAPFMGTATWLGDPYYGSDLEYSSGTASIQQPSTSADVNTFYAWMNALTSNGSVAGSFSILSERNNFSAISATSDLWVNVSGASPPISTFPTSFPVTYTFDTPVATPPACGRVIYSDFHVSSGSSGTFPGECTYGDPGEMSPQEKSLEYLIWDLASCPPSPPAPSCTPGTCASEGFDCGPQGDGCGGSLSCGTCAMGLTCGGGGPGKCGKSLCKPKTCKELGFDCGPAGDGCGGSLNCGSCTGGATCGGAGSPGQCGTTIPK